MSESQILNPDNYLIGDPIRDSFGVVCRPAINEEDGTQHFIKQIYIPASQAQTEALLLSGAYENAAEVQAYFHSVAVEITKEASLMAELGQENGFLPFDHCEMTESQSIGGYVVHLQSERHGSIFDRQWTHRDAIQFATDMCAALSACRAKGMLYVDLKPENVFISDTDKFCIGDLGFVSMESLQFISLPDKYRSIYTAPEIADSYATISPNADVYALGMMLYSIYNHGIPCPDQLTPAEYADYEMWKIISKACHNDPMLRYSDPNQLRIAIEDYVAQFGIADEHIILAENNDVVETTEDDRLFLSEEENDSMLSSLLNSIPDEQPPVDSIDEMDSHTENEDDNYLQMEEILAQADDLIHHQLPQPVVAPTAYEVAIPEIVQPIEPEPEVTEQPDNENDTQPQDAVETIEEEIIELPDEDPVQEVETAEDESIDDTEIWDAPKKSNFKKVMIILSIISAVLLLFIAGIFIYINCIFNQEINDLTISYTSESVSVVITSDIDDKLLTVVCTNAHGTALRSSVKDGKAEINGLKPNTTYRITIEISGMHMLVGKTSDIFTTASMLNISALNVVDGVWEGSVELSFVATGNENNDWVLRYYTEGELEQTISFTGSKVSVTGLKAAKKYTFIVEPAKEIPLIGTNRITYDVK